jgi:murein DD-endopeptidase MepM/ murein hydrolase activator NlpD
VTSSGPLGPEGTTPAADDAGGAPGSGGEALEGGSPNHSRTPDLSTDQLLSGTYSTAKLVAAAALLRAAEWSRERIRREVYAPVIVVGPSSWTDSWHAPRHGPGSVVRQHEGQDVLCRHGTEVLSPENGTIDFGSSLLGGRSARLLRPDGGFYYFAHLVRWNDREFSDGDRVHRGDVIGFCGDTGNATAPHVHFGWYGPDGVAIDPMRRLISWLREAEEDLPALVSEALGDAGTADGAFRSGTALDFVRGLGDAPLPEASLTVWRNASASTPQRPLDLTPVLVFLVLFGSRSRRPARRSTRWRRSIHSRDRGISSAWGERRGPLIS